MAHPNNRINWFARWLPYADWSIGLLYLAALWSIALPDIRIGYDPYHHFSLLMSSLRILDGQVPYRDFYPWYGPLFHYFMAFWVWLLGGDLAATKLFIGIVSTSLSMAMLIATLRLFRLAPWGRFFVALASGWWVFDTYFQIGATRTFLGLCLVGLWVAGLRKTQGGWPRVDAGQFTLKASLANFRLFWQNLDSDGHKAR